MSPHHHHHEPCLQYTLYSPLPHWIWAGLVLQIKGRSDMARLSLHQKKACSFYLGHLEYSLWGNWAAVKEVWLPSSHCAVRSSKLATGRSCMKRQKCLASPQPLEPSRVRRQMWAKNCLGHPSQSSLQMTPAPAAMWLQTHERPQTKNTQLSR